MYLIATFAGVCCLPIFALFYLIQVLSAVGLTVSETVIKALHDGMNELVHYAEFGEWR